MIFLFPALQSNLHLKPLYTSVADPGFPVGGACTRWGGGGRGPPTWALFGENVCKNERIGSHGGGGHALGTPPRSANAHSEW